jgi:hypothetical protein
VGTSLSSRLSEAKVDETRLGIAGLSSLSLENLCSEGAIRRPGGLSRRHKERVKAQQAQTNEAVVLINVVG